MALCGGMVLPAGAQQAAEADTLKNVLLKDVQVNAPFRRVDYHFAPFQNTLKGKQLFQAQPRTLPEALQGISGIWVQQTDHGGGTPIIRGLLGYQTVMLIDGIRLNNASFPAGPLPYLNTIDGLAIEQVTVLPGAASVSYGSDAMGGVVNMQSQSARFGETKQWQSHGGITGRATTGGMEYAGRAELNLSNDTWALHAGADVKKFGDVHAGKGKGIESPSGYNEWAADVKLQRRLGTSSLLTAAYQGMRQNDIPTYILLTTGKYDTYKTHSQKRDLGYLNYAYHPLQRMFHSFETTVAYTRQAGERWVQLKGNPTLAVNDDDVRTVAWTADVDLNVLPWWRMKGGTDVYFDKIFSSAENREKGTSTTRPGSFPDGSSMLSYGIFLQNAWTWGRLSAGAGVRYSGNKLSLDNKDFGHVNLTPHALVGDFHISYELFPHFTAAYVLGSSFRAPTINDVSKLGLADSWYFVPNFNIRPEKGLNMEIDLKYDNGTTRISANIYRNRLKDLLGLVAAQTSDGRTEVNGIPVRMKQNMSEAYVEGIEFAAEQQLCTSVSAFGNLTYTYGQNSSDDVPLSKIPPLFGRVGVRYLKGQWQATLFSDMARKQDRLSPMDKEDARIPKGGTPGYVTLNLQASYELPHWELSAIFGNMLNKGYRMHGSGIDAYGIHGKLSIGYRF